MERPIKDSRELEALIGKIASITELTGGKNSQVLKIMNTENQLYVLKKYKNVDSRDRRDRRVAEKRVLRIYIESEARRKVPKLIGTSKKENWNLLTYIDGVRPIGIDFAEINEFVEFIAQINKDMYKIKKLANASDAIIKHGALPKIIEDQMTFLSSIEPSNKMQQESSEWIRSVLEPNWERAKSEYERCETKQHWNNIGEDEIASPSDVGIHNMLISEKRVYFIDFEYAGKDDISKLIGDMVCRPGNNFDAYKEELLINQIADRLAIKMIIIYKGTGI